MALFMFLLGLCIGSFLNVVIGRVPKGESIVFPTSHCTTCQKRIPPFDLIPVISWLLLKGRCRSCHAGISWRYPAEELLTGLLFLWAYSVFGYSSVLLLMLVLASVLTAISWIDWEHGIIPFSILAVGAVPAFSFAIFAVHLPFLDALAGAFVGGGSILAVDLLARLIYKQPGMGGGDVALMLMAGLFLGLKNTLLSLLIGVLLGGVYAVFLLLTGRAKKDATFPFGPFLAGGIWVSALYGERLIRWYWMLVFNVLMG